MIFLFGCVTGASSSDILKESFIVSVIVLIFSLLLRSGNQNIKSLFLQEKDIFSSNMHSPSTVWIQLEQYFSANFFQPDILCTEQL